MPFVRRVLKHGEMHMKNLLKLAAISAILIGSSVSLASPSLVEQAQTIQWNEASRGELQSLLNSPSAIQMFANSALGATDLPANIGEYSFVDLSGDGNFELVATLDYSGRGFYTTLVIFSNINGKIHATQAKTNGASIDNLQASIVDLNHDGRHELLVPRLMGQYHGADPVPMFTDIYVFRQGVLVQADSQFKFYYRDERLPKLTARLDLLRSGRATADSDVAQKSINALQQEISEINRVLTQN